VTPLVLLHAFPLSSAMYDEVRERIDHPVIAPDFPGFGDAALSDAAPSLDVYADRVAAELDRAGVERAVIAGTSMGGYTAMAFCRRHGKRVAGLGLIDTKASADPATAAEGRRSMADAMASGRTTAPLIEHVLPKLLGSTTKQTRPDVVDRVTAAVASCNPNAAAWAQRAMARRPDSLHDLASVTVPSLVVVGEEDILSPPSDADEMVSALPDGELTVIARSGHLTPIEAPAQVADSLMTLLQRVDG
jgi:pimeloyl-ACP methyl ester carboxylesterase